MMGTASSQPKKDLCRKGHGISSLPAIDHCTSTYMLTCPGVPIPFFPSPQATEQLNHACMRIQLSSTG
ncbi:hypothetical protein BRADI_4g45315v3 [Brachypodium distachyon]|uniref:Uncharacterized protein n=1 Tax=Brachypodium distachyon TaxID=15368 RepID=A0A2K2CUE4_BRADI|nr:hypothetical protein BRADI_4g45315v3 [Brachypodium distachyon]